MVLSSSLRKRCLGRIVWEKQRIERTLSWKRWLVQMPLEKLRIGRIWNVSHRDRAWNARSPSTVDGRSWVSVAPASKRRAVHRLRIQDVRKRKRDKPTKSTTPSTGRMAASTAQYHTPRRAAGENDLASCPYHTSVQGSRVEQLHLPYLMQCGKWLV